MPGTSAQVIRANNLTLFAKIFLAITLAIAHQSGPVKTAKFMTPPTEEVSSALPTPISKKP